MNILKDFLRRFEKIKNPKEDKMAIAATLSQFLKVEITNDSIAFTHSVVTLSKVPALVRNLVFQHKEKILEMLKEKHPHLTIVDVKFF
jgi:hypothetical protein